MVTKNLIFGAEAIEKLAAGADKLARAVTTTLGPRSGNVTIESPFPYAPRVVHDGITVAQNVILEDPAENMGSYLLLDAAGKTNDAAGDGTTTAILLANTIVQLGKDLVSSGVDSQGVIRNGINQMKLREELIKWADVICTELDKIKKEIKEKKDIQHVATISAQNEKIGAIVADVIEKVGKDGIIIPEESSGAEDSFEHVHGMEFENGFLAAEFVTNTRRMIAEYQEDGYILLVSGVISSHEDIVPIIEKVRNDGNKPLLIIADDVVGTAIQTMAISKVKAQYKLCAVMAPEYAERRAEMLEDIAILTGGVVINRTYKKVKEAEISDLGRFSHLKVTFTHTMITPKNPDDKDIKERVIAIKQQIDDADSPFRKERLQYRLAKLGQGVVTIKVTGASNSERDEKKERYIDSVQAVKAALAEGVVAGGGTALASVASRIGLNLEDPIHTLVFEVLQTPRNTIQMNAGVESTSIKEDPEIVYDVLTKKFVPAFETGIIDPVRVTKEAVRNAFSTAAMILTTRSLIVNNKEEEKK